MTDNIITFKKKEPEAPSSVEILNLNMTQGADGVFEMYMEINEDFSDLEVYIALEAAAAKWGVENNLIEMDYFDVSDEDNTDD